MEKDLYEVLQVQPSAEPEVIEAAYRRLTLKYHPDHNKAPDAAATMRELNAAREVLGDPDRRARYDRERALQARDLAREDRDPDALQAPPSPGPETADADGAIDVSLLGLVGLGIRWRKRSR